VIAAAPTALRLLFGLLDIALGLWLVLLSALALRGRLRRNVALGLRTSATLADPEHFTLANRVAGGPWLVAGAIGIVTGALAFLMPTVPAVLTVGILGLLGTVGLTGAGAVLGHRAATALPTNRCTGCGCLRSGSCERMPELS
jgi:predicted membrane-bound dolichyl-phosphate-mannose-protein mannosyltransferase